MKNIKKFLIIISILAVSACDLNKLDNPGFLSAEKADINLQVNNIQISFADFYHNIHDLGQQMTRLNEFFGPTYENGYTPLSFDYSWTAAYQNILVNTKAIEATADSKGYPFHGAIAKVL